MARNALAALALLAAGSVAAPSSASDASALISLSVDDERCLAALPSAIGIGPCTRRDAQWSVIGQGSAYVSLAASGRYAGKCTRPSALGGEKALVYAPCGPETAFWMLPGPREEADPSGASSSAASAAAAPALGVACSNEDVLWWKPPAERAKCLGLAPSRAQRAELVTCPRSDSSCCVRVWTTHLTGGGGATAQPATKSKRKKLSLPKLLAARAALVARRAYKLLLSRAAWCVRFAAGAPAELATLCRAWAGVCWAQLQAWPAFPTVGPIAALQQAPPLPRLPAPAVAALAGATHAVGHGAKAAVGAIANGTKWAGRQARAAGGAITNGTKWAGTAVALANGTKWAAKHAANGAVTAGRATVNTSRWVRVHGRALLAMQARLLGQLLLLPLVVFDTAADFCADLSDRVLFAVSDGLEALGEAWKRRFGRATPGSVGPEQPASKSELPGKEAAQPASPPSRNERASAKTPAPGKSSSTPEAPVLWSSSSSPGFWAIVLGCAASILLLAGLTLALPGEGVRPHTRADVGAEKRMANGLYQKPLPGAKAKAAATAAAATVASAMATVLGSAAGTSHRSALPSARSLPDSPKTLARRATPAAMRTPRRATSTVNPYQYILLIVANMKCANTLATQTPPHPLPLPISPSFIQKATQTPPASPSSRPVLSPAARAEALAAATASLREAAAQVASAAELVASERQSAPKIVSNRARSLQHEAGVDSEQAARRARSRLGLSESQESLNTLNTLLESAESTAPLAEFVDTPEPPRRPQPPDENAESHSVDSAGGQGGDSTGEGGQGGERGLGSAPSSPVPHTPSALLGYKTQLAPESLQKKERKRLVIYYSGYNDSDT
ncbi:hypothetical protein T492DRAFT_836270 [Pavlovales sp. CCMP2436]|nr:hypothetical protein T492DRAFT_836270 [Pavlovales sp. CCMP2436]